MSDMIFGGMCPVCGNVGVDSKSIPVNVEAMGFRCCGMKIRFDPDVKGNPYGIILENGYLCVFNEKEINDNEFRM